MNRKDFLKLSSGLIGSLSISAGWGSFASATTNLPDNPEVMDDSYLAKGLAAMARTDHWFDAHWGAAVIAGYYLCKENQLDAQTILAVKNQLDSLIQLRADQFAPFPSAPSNEALINNVPQALLPTFEGGLRAHGHAVIFASLSTKALLDVPHMAQPAIIQRLCGLSDRISKNTPQKINDHETPAADSQTMIEATFDSLLRFKELLGRPSVRRPNFTHMVTHTEALLNLEEMGYAELADKGRPAHHIHISVPVPEIDPGIESESNDVTLETVMSPDLWNDAEKQDQWNRAWNATNNRNGHWIASGHLFKVLYAFHRLINRIEDEEQKKLCGQILLERYVNPEVQGG